MGILENVGCVFGMEDDVLQDSERLFSMHPNGTVTDLDSSGLCSRDTSSTTDFDDNAYTSRQTGTAARVSPATSTDPRI